MSCNLACRICSPANSTKFMNELSPHKDSLPAPMAKSLGRVIDLFDQYGNLSDSNQFMKELWDHIDEVDYIELHGGEPYINKRLWEFLESLSTTDHAKRINIYSHCNLTSVTDQQIEILNRFVGGRVNVSIDAADRENEFIRYYSDWRTTEQNFPKFGHLHEGFVICIGTSVSAYQACTIDKLLIWLDEFLQRHPDLNVTWLVWPVVKPDMFRVDLVPLELRLATIERIKAIAKECFACNEYGHAKGMKYGVETLINLLSNQIQPSQEQIDSFISYTKALDKVRGQDSFTMFPT